VPFSCYDIGNYHYDIGNNTNDNNYNDMMIQSTSVS
jgi:hypothetical protein